MVSSSLVRRFDQHVQRCQIRSLTSYKQNAFGSTLLRMGGGETWSRAQSTTDRGVGAEDFVQ